MSAYTLELLRREPPRVGRRERHAHVVHDLRCASELAVDLFEIDLQRVVSKYIAETEKNLDALFDAASASDAVLWFEDSDHLFAVPAKDIDDSGRFPNLSVSRLRQRLESYNGVVMLGTRERAEVDPKFARQCDEVVDL